MRSLLKRLLLVVTVGVVRRCAVRARCYSVLVVGVAALTVVVSAASAPEGRDVTSAPGSVAPRARTLLTIDGYVDHFAQDGNRLAWVRPASVLFGPSYIESFDLRRQRRIILGRLTEGDDVVAFGLAGTQVLVAVLEAGVCSNSGCSFGLQTTSWAKPRLRAIGETSYEDLVRPPIAGDGRTLVYFAHCSYDCKARDGIYRVSGGRTWRVADSGFPTHLVASGSRVAIAEITTSTIDRSSPAWSPSGTEIAFARTQREPSGSAWRIVDSGSGIYVRGRRQSGGERRLIAGVTTSLDWSRDGQLVFERPVPDDHEGDLFIANADGTGERHLVAGASPRWSPDGSRIAFTRDGQIYVVNEDGSGLERVALGNGVAWSPDGTRLAVASGDGVSFFGVDGTPAGRLPRLSGYLKDLDWSPDGSRIAFSESSDEYPRTDIHITRLDGGGRRTLARIGKEADSLDPRWAPDGAVLAFAHGDSYVVYPEEPVPSQLFLTAGTAVRRLTAPAKQRTTISVRQAAGGSLQARFDLAADVMDLALSPSFLAVLVRKGTTVRLQIRDARTGILRQSFHPPNACCSIQIAGSTVLLNDQLLDIASGRVTRLPAVATPTKRPGTERRVAWGPLLIEGRRLTWVEIFRIGKKYKSQVRVLALPKR